MFYDNLLEVCKEKGVSVTPIVEECGGRRGSISGWKNGSWPSSQLVAALAVRLDVTTDRLLLGADAKKDADAIRGISDDALKVGCLWDRLDAPGQAIILGDIYRRLEAASGEAGRADGQQLKKAR